MRSFTNLSLISFAAVALFAQSALPPAAPGLAGGGSAGGGAAVAGVLGAAPVGYISNSNWTFSSARSGAFGGTVTGAPYSAEQVTEHVQTLSDGTHITQPAQTTKFYRDSQGRTRTERSAPLPPGPLGKGVEAPVFVEISDPVAGVRYTLETQGHTAHAMPMHVLRPPVPPPPTTAENGAAVPKTIRLVPAQRSGQFSSALPDQALQPVFSHESLGTQTIEGVLAEGTRTTVTYPVGAIGNDRPFVTTSENWASAELKLVVLSKESDPRSGDSSTRLINISRAEPDASLFQVPPDYEIIEPK